MNILDKIKNCDKPFFSLEFYPPKEKEDQETFFKTVEKFKAVNPLFASVTYGAGGSSQNATLEIAARIKKESKIEPMVHYTCVGATEEKITLFLDALKEAEIHNVLALRGDTPKNTVINWTQEPFPHAEDLVKLIINQRPDLGIAAAAYPAPHPESPTFALDQHYLRAKVLAGTQFLVTQLFFDVREYIALVNSLQGYNINIPVIPGILPVQSLASLKRTMAMCGANLPAKFYFQLEEAHEKFGSEAVKELGIKFAINQIKQLIDLGAPGVHLYTLNRSDLCLNLIDQCF